jgi:DeoR family transcriptional regulator, aga operon transcriptional repressor
MFKESRFQKIQEIVNKNGAVKVTELAEMLSVSAMTIRRDLQSMLDKGLIDRTYGGAVLSKEHNLLQTPILLRIQDQREEKQAIVREVAKMIKHGESIYIASGTTTYWLAKAIANRTDLTVVTNSLPIANLLIPFESVDLIVVGGFLRRKEFSLVGHFAERMVRDLRMDKVIIGCGGVSPEFGITNEYPEEMMMDRAYMSISDNVIMVADHTKIGRVTKSYTGPITAVRTIVTSSLASLETVEQLRHQGVEVILV